jgi:hypothetical protein
LDKFRQQHNIDLSNNKIALRRIKEAAEKAKIELSSVNLSDIDLPFLHYDKSGSKHLKLKITREKLEILVNNLISRTLKPCENCLKDSGVKDDIIQSYNSQPLLKHVLFLSNDISEIINRHPAITIFIIKFLYNTFKNNNKTASDVDSIRNLFFSKGYYMADTPERLIPYDKEFNDGEFFVLEKLFSNDIGVAFEKTGSYYPMAKNLERKGYVYETIDNEFSTFNFTAMFLKRKLYIYLYSSREIISFNLNGLSLLDFTIRSVKLLRTTKLKEIASKYGSFPKESFRDKQLYNSMTKLFVKFGFRRHTNSSKRNAEDRGCL